MQCSFNWRSLTWTRVSNSCVLSHLRVLCSLEGEPWRLFLFFFSTIQMSFRSFFFLSIFSFFILCSPSVEYLWASPILSVSLHPCILLLLLLVYFFFDSYYQFKNLAVYHLSIVFFFFLFFFPSSSLFTFTSLPSALWHTVLVGPYYPVPPRCQHLYGIKHPSFCFFFFFSFLFVCLFLLFAF